ncbi:helix-turn-helix transcriptional regulator [Hyphomicrobium denitrificans]|nr:hypothetical protein [Hyphomicrobium denitrificans]
MLPADAPTVASWIIAERPVPSNLALDLAELLYRLIGEECLLGSCIEATRSPSPVWCLEAFGVSGFLDDRYALSYCQDPHPWLALTLFSEAHDNHPVAGLLNHSQIAAGNANGGLSLVPLLWIQRPIDASEASGRELSMLGQQTLIRSHRGYRLNRILKEVPAAALPMFLAGGFLQLRKIPAGTLAPFLRMTAPDERVLVGLSREDVERGDPGSAIAWLFTGNRPVCRFTRAEQSVLLGATEGLIDQEIATQLKISANAVKERWRSIYERVESVLPHVFTQVAINSESRGPEKRRRVLAYIDDHPEELRPYSG